MIDFLVNCLPQLFDWVLKTTFMASILVGLILLVKTLLRSKLTPRWHYLLWIILIVRLLLPWSLESPYSIYSILAYGDKTTISLQNKTYDFFKNESLQETKTISSSKIIEDGKYNVVKLPQITEGGTQKTTNKKTMNAEMQKDIPISFHTIAFYVWLSGVLVFSFITYWANHRLKTFIKKQSIITDKKVLNVFKKCRNSMPIQKNIPLLFGDGIPSPMIYGFYRPKILLPKSLINHLTETQLRHIFYHELAHIKRGDIIVNWLMYILLILNWFNPILWLAYYCMRNDQELSCDAYALTFMAEEEKTSYGYTIINLLEHYSSFYQVPSLANMSRNKRILKRRIFLIKKFKKKSYRWFFLGIITVLTVASISLFNAQSDVKAIKGNEKVIENSYETGNAKMTLNSSNSVNEEGPLVYLYHTHNLESFVTESNMEDPALVYDETNNITLVGDRLSELLKEADIQSIHEDTNIAQILKEKNLPFSESYTVSGELLKDTIERNESIKMVLDIHRGVRKRGDTTIKISDKDYAKINFIVSGSSNKFEENKEFATLLHHKFEEQYPSLSGGVQVKNNSSYQNTYNQDLFGNSVLIEIGGFENTLQEEYRTADILAEVIKELLLGE